MTDVIFTLRSELDLFFNVPKYGIGTMKYDFYFHKFSFHILLCNIRIVGRAGPRFFRAGSKQKKCGYLSKQKEKENMYYPRFEPELLKQRL